MLRDMNSLQKIAKWSDGTEEPFSHPPVFKVANTSTGAPRIAATVQDGNLTLIQSLMRELEGPIYILYVLHTTRGEGPIGRYRSPSTTLESACQFLERFRTYLQRDSRFDLWLHFPNPQATIVWDRHNLLYLYGPIQHFEARLASLGFKPGDPNVNFPHAHYYRSECDADARALLEYCDWQYSELRPEDEQRTA